MEKELVTNREYETGLVSIIMPMYNAGRFVREAIESVQQQDYTNWELLVVNDGSSDNGPEIVAEMADNDARIILINKDNLITILMNNKLFLKEYLMQ